MGAVVPCNTLFMELVQSVDTFLCLLNLFSQKLHLVSKCGIGKSFPGLNVYLQLTAINSLSSLKLLLFHPFLIPLFRIERVRVRILANLLLELPIQSILSSCFLSYLIRFLLSRFFNCLTYHLPFRFLPLLLSVDPESALAFELLTSQINTMVMGICM